MDVVESGGRGGDVVKVFFTHRLKSVLRPVKTGDTGGSGDAGGGVFFTHRLKSVLRPVKTGDTERDGRIR